MWIWQKNLKRAMLEELDIPRINRGISNCGGSMRKIFEKFWVVGAIFLLSVPVLQIIYAFIDPSLTTAEFLISNKGLALWLIATGVVCYCIAYFAEEKG